MTICMACHGGRVNPRGYHWRPGQMRQQVREGNGLMPPISPRRISDSDVEAVLAYLSTIEAIEGELPPAPTEPRARARPEPIAPSEALELDEEDTVEGDPAADTTADDTPPDDAAADDAAADDAAADEPAADEPAADEPAADDTAADDTAADTPRWPILLEHLVP